MRSAWRARPGPSRGRGPIPSGQPPCDPARARSIGTGKPTLSWQAGSRAPPRASGGRGRSQREPRATHVHGGAAGGLAPGAHAAGAGPGATQLGPPGPAPRHAGVDGRRPAALCGHELDVRHDRRLESRHLLRVPGSDGQRRRVCHRSHPIERASLVLREQATSGQLHRAWEVGRPAREADDRHRERHQNANGHASRMACLATGGTGSVYESWAFCG